MRSIQRSKSMHAFYGGFLHRKTSLTQFVHEFDKVLGNKEQKELDDDGTDSKGVLHCVSNSLIELQFQQEYTSHMFRDVQEQFLKKGDCIVKVLSKEGDTYSLSKNVRRKHTYIKSCHDVNHSDESNKLYRGLCSHFFNVAQDFVRNIEEASILHSAMDDAQTTLHDHCASKDQSSVPSRQSNKAPETQCSISVDRLLGPLQVSTNGRPTKRRLGA
ncbi:hypothetical protein PIB30_017194 [Stylosanthes scabra]|uniref:Protein FAR1-RELATED SEQUENCE n=1 Tax=Stylosanthes scabra TaxID=79078 RepID=A0ABU6X8D2_9FABA|nr:hypothetical protein [Stylosanthes scabra]